MTETTLPHHTDLPAKYTWNAPSVFPSDEAWENDWNQISAQLPDHTHKYRGRLAGSAALVYDCLQTRDETVRRAQVLMVYADMASSVDSTDQKAVAMAGRARSLYGQVRATFAFVEPELITIGAVKLRGWVNSEPRLAL